MNVISPSLVTNYLDELTADDEAIEAAAAEYESAKARLDVRLRRYIALRDFITEQMGRSPYAHGVSWPSDTPSGSFRFTGMQIGEAVIQVLQDAKAIWRDNPWLGLDEIIERLADGGLGFPEPVQARAINAALLKTTGVRRGRDQTGRVYRYEPPKDDEDEDEGGDDMREEEEDVEPDDLPF